MLDYQWFGLRPGGHHLTSLLLHAASAVLLLLVLHRMTGALWRSVVVAALFALHPLHVESVAWVAERKDVLSTLFVMLTLWAYQRYTECRRQKPRMGFWASPFYLLSVVFFGAGLMSKPMIVTLPLILLLLDYWPLRRVELAALVSRPSVAAGLIVEKLPFVLLASLTGWITVHAAEGVGSLPSATQCPMADRLANATLSYAGYFLQVFWPGNLAVYYPLPATFSVWGVGGAALLLVGISVTAFCVAGRWPYVVVGWLWYLVTLLPVIGLIQLATYSHADRYTYVPLIGVFLALTWGAHELTRSWRYQVPALWVASGAAIILCLALTRQQLGHWKDGEVLFRHAVEVTEDNDRALNNLGIALDQKGQIDEAIRQFEAAIRMKPGHPNAHYNLGIALDKKGRTDEAIGQFKESIRLKPDQANARYNLGIVLGRRGQMDEAIRQYQEAIRLKPDYAEAYNDLGIALGRKGQMDEAIRQFQEAARLRPDYAEAHFNLGLALGLRGQSADAIRHFEEALKAKPDYPEAHNYLGSALYQQSRTGEAIRQFQAALRIRPDYADARKNLDAALATKSDDSRPPGAATNR
jgi:tetratricopeptide (TPR) repeat protein